MKKDEIIYERTGLDPDRHCFACGKANPIGLQLVFSYTPEKAHTEISFSNEHQGWDNIVHGGLVSTVLDESMAHAVLAHLGRAVTASMNVRFRHPVPTGQCIHFVGEVVERRGKIVETRASAILPDQTLAAEAKARFVLV